MRVCFINVFAVILLALIVGCREQQRGGPRLETYATTGVVKIDGEPGDLVEVQCHPGPDATGIKYTLSTMTDKDGKFSLTTYESGDGLPEGTYTLTFQWLEPGFVPKDKLKGAYADPKKSTHSIKVVKGQPTDAGVIELSSKGPAK